MHPSASLGEFPLRPPEGLNPAELREWFAVACELDRVRLRLAARPTVLERVSLSVLEKVIPLVPHLPGKIGRWSRGILEGTNVLRSVYDLIFN
jgi:hypothetical protein